MKEEEEEEAANKIEFNDGEEKYLQKKKNVPEGSRVKWRKVLSNPFKINVLCR